MDDTISRKAVLNLLTERYRLLREASETPLPNDSVLVQSDIQACAVVVKALIDEAKKLPIIEAEQKWIPVSEPPKEKGRYWCNVKSFSFPGDYYQTVLKWDDGFIEGNIYTDDVTHWMPLPEPPKGD